MSDIYEQHQSAFARVSAFVILRDGERVATVALKFPADGAGRLYAYLHVIGLPMVRAYAGGYGYDKRSAAIAAAASRVSSGDRLDVDSMPEANRAGYIRVCEEAEATAAFWQELAPTLDNGNDWTRGLEKAGFTVLQAV